jgi:UDP-N-acetylglucosamine acyltransferase
VTRIGSGNLLMVNVHIGHDCQIGDNCILANNVMLAGHVVLGNSVVMSGGSATHHFVTIGDFAFVAGLAAITHDVPPFVKVSDGDRIRAVNSVGLKRAGYSPEDIEEIEAAVRKIFFNRKKQIATVLSEFDLLIDLHPQVKTIIEFLRRRDAGKFGRHLESLRKKKG